MHYNRRRIWITFPINPLETIDHRCRQNLYILTERETDRVIILGVNMAAAILRGVSRYAKSGGTACLALKASPAN